MKLTFLAILFASLIFLLIDIIWLSYSVKFFYKPQIGHLLTDRPVMWAAISFYLIYIIAITFLILIPSINNDSIFQAFWTGIILGLAAYGTYNLTNMATIKGWSINVVFVDLIWGGLLTGTSSSLGIYLSKKIIG